MPESVAYQGLGRISVIVANYNYDQFVGAAIESALALDWPDVEVIVVDDGSTDDSRRVIEAFADRVTTVFQENATQRVARNRGFALSTGEAIIHLDSDDVLFPCLARELARVWRPGITKVQFQMLRIDENGQSLKSTFPRFRSTPTPDQIRQWARWTTAYPTPPGSGNAYSRAFLEQIFPLDDSCGPATDSACLAVAPFLGDVVTITRPLVGYRVHGRNTSDLMADDKQFRRAIERAQQRYRYTIRTLHGTEPRDAEAALRRSRSLLQLRVAAVRLEPHIRPPLSDSRRRLLWDAVRSPLYPGPESAGKRLAILAWSALVLLTPESAARGLISMRFRRPGSAVPGRLGARCRTLVRWFRGRGPRRRTALPRLDLTSARVLSTDLFDTLLLRDGATETTRLEMAARRAAPLLRADPAVVTRLRWSIHRLAYLAVALERPDGEASLAAMSQAVAAALGRGQAAARQLAAIEVEVDRRHLRPNRRLLAALEDAARAGTRVIAVSDTWYSELQLRRLLESVLGSHPVAAVYSSADVQKTKHEGGLYQFVAEWEKVAPDLIVHLGDNRDVDVEMARAAGWTGVHLPPPRRQRVSTAAGRLLGIAARVRRGR